MADGITLENVVKTYGDGDTAVHALRGVNMAVAKGEVVGLIGPSGSGKSTMLKCLGAVIEPTSGRMTISDQCIYENGWKVRDLRALRRDLIGFIFQAPYLIPFLDVTDNVALLPMLAGKPNAVARKHARDLLDALDVGHLAAAMPSQLSGGEQQMLAIGRALMTNPRLLILDEATEGLAPLVREDIWACLAALKRAGQTILVIDKYVEKLVKLADSHTLLERGRVVWQGSSAALDADRALWHRYLGV